MAALCAKHGADSVQVRYHGGVVHLNDSPIVYRGRGVQYLSPRELMMHAYRVLETAEIVARVETDSTTPSALAFRRSVVKDLLAKHNADEVVVLLKDSSVHFTASAINEKKDGLFVEKSANTMLAKKILMHPETKWRGVVMTKAVHSELTPTEVLPGA